MPTIYVNSFDQLGEIILSPRALPGSPSLTADYVAERDAAVRNSTAAADAVLEEHKRVAAAALAAAVAARETSIANAKASAAGAVAALSTSLRTSHEATLRPLLRSWFFDNPTYTLADQIASARAQWLLDTQEQCGAPFRHHFLLVCADILAIGNATAALGPRVMSPAAGMRQLVAANIYNVGTGLISDVDKSLRAGGAKTFLALQALESWLLDRMQEAATLSGAPLTTANALLACGTASEARALIAIY
jgi:hypothetical protein